MVKKKKGAREIWLIDRGSSVKSEARDVKMVENEK